MGNFNLDEYETVDSRIKRFYEDHPQGRITTKLVDSSRDAGKTRWVVKAYVFRDQEEKRPAGTGLAFEIDGEGGMVNKTAALENAETSSIGRALANIGYSGAKRPSQEEMRKTQEPVDTRALDVLVDEWIAEFDKADTIPALQAAWEKAGAAGVTGNRRVIDAKDARKAHLEKAA